MPEQAPHGQVTPGSSASGTAVGGDRETSEPDLDAMTTEELLACVDAVPRTDSAASSVWFCGASGHAELASVLAERHVERDLLAKYPTASLEQRYVIVYALALDHSVVPGVARLMNRVAYGRSRYVDESDEVMWAKIYLASECDQRVLAECTRRPYGHWKSSACYEYGWLAPSYAKCRYRAGIPILLGTLDNFSGNKAAIAEEALRVFYPNNEKLTTLRQVRRYYCDRYRAEGHKLGPDYCKEDPPSP